MSSKDFTEREINLMALAWRCFDEQPKVNYQQLADLAGMTNPKSASNAWSKIVGKLAAQGGDGSSTPKAKSTPKKRGKKAADEDEGGEGEEAAPPKKKRAAPKKKAKKSATPDESEGEQDAAAVKDEAGDDGEGV